MQRVVVASALLLAACTPAKSAPKSAAPECRYRVDVIEPTAVLDVTARCTGATISAFTGDPRLAPFTTGVRDARGAVRLDGRHWLIPETENAELHYRVDLDAAARALGDVDEAFAEGRSLVAPLSSYALVPEPLRAGSASLVVQPGPGGEFVTELEESGDAYRIPLTTIPDATYGVFGHFAHDVARLGGVHGESHVDIVSLDGSFALSPAERTRWVARAASAVGNFYGGFPAEHTGVVLADVSGRDRVVFGKVLSGGGSTVVLFVGDRTTTAALDGDWVLVHELFHLGFPSFRGEGKWLDEGLATYAEPLIRTRAGMLSEERGWAEVVRDMPLGARLCETLGLEHYQEIRSVYWAGAVVALLADVAARRRSAGAPGIEQALRAMIAKGWDSRHVVRVDEAVAMIDAELGANVLAPLAAAYRDGGHPVPLDAVLADLGVERTGDGVRLHDDAPLASVRRAITWGDAGPSAPHPTM